MKEEEIKSGQEIFHFIITQHRRKKIIRVGNSTLKKI
jgi:hypothetical protein